MQLAAVVRRPELVDLVGDRERIAQVLGRRVRLVLDDDVDLGVPGVAVEVSADQLAVVLPTVEGVGGAVAAAEALAAAHERQEAVLLCVRQWQFARGVEEHGVEVLEVLGRDLSARILRANHVEAVLLTQLDHRGLDQAPLDLGDELAGVVVEDDALRRVDPPVVVADDLVDLLALVLDLDDLQLQVLDLGQVVQVEIRGQRYLAVHAAVLEALGFGDEQQVLGRRLRGDGPLGRGGGGLVNDPAFLGHRDRLDLDVLVPAILAVLLHADVADALEILDRLLELVLGAIGVLAHLVPLVQVHVDDLLAVHHHLDDVVGAGQFDVVPLAGRLHGVLGGGQAVVDGAAVVAGQLLDQAAVDHLHLEARINLVVGVGDAEEDPAVALGVDLEVDAEDEVAELLVVVGPAAAALVRVDAAVLDVGGRQVLAGFQLPVLGLLAIEQELPAFLFFLGRELIVLGGGAAGAGHGQQHGQAEPPGCGSHDSPS